MHLLKYYNIALDRLDLVVAVIGLLMGVIITSLYLISSTIYLLMLGLALFLSSLLYLFLQKHVYTYTHQIQRKIAVLSEILFFFLFSGSLILIHQSLDGRPALYFYLVGACAAFIGLSITCIGDQRRGSLLQVVKILLLSLNIKYSIYYYYGGFTMPDVWRHAVMSRAFAQTGDLSSLWYKEEFFPLMHINAVIHSFLLNVDIKNALNYAVILALVISTICVYLFARKYFGNKIGLLALLIINLTDYNILWGSAPQTTSFGLTLYYFIIYSLSNTIEGINAKKWALICILFIITIIFTHVVSSFILVTTIMLFLLGSLLYKILYNRAATLYCVYMLTVSVTALIGYWFNAMYRSYPLFDTLINQLAHSVSSYASFLNRPETYTEYAVTLPPLLERMADMMGLSILAFFAAIGAFYLLSPRYRNKLNFTLVFCICIILTITFGFPLFGIRNIIPDRWFGFAYFFMSIFGAFALYQISKHIKRSYVTNAFIMITIFMLAFFMASSTISNKDSPLWLEESTISNTYTVPEMQGASTLSNHFHNITSDGKYLGYVLMMYYGYEPNAAEHELHIWRKYTLTRPISIARDLEGDYASSYAKLRYQPTILGAGYQNNLLKKHCKVYDNPDISAFIIM
jgi:hypothetical protein